MNKTRTILIGIDGCDFRILRPLLEDGYLPTFSEVLKHGSHGTLISTIPPNSLPAWTSIFTGVNPGKHGITDFIIREGGEFKIAINSYRMVDTIWAILNRFNLKQIIVNEPVTYPTEKICGIMLTGFWTPPQSENFAFPPTIKDEVNKVCHGYEPDLPVGFEKTIAADRSKGFELITKFAYKIFRVTKYLSRNYDWDLLSVTFTSTDKVQHFYFNDPQCIRSHYQLIDGFINKIINLEPNANLIIISDHGFGPLKKCFYINTWLRDQSLAIENRSSLNALLSHLGLTYQKLVSSLMKIKLHEILSKIAPTAIKRSVPRSTKEATLDFDKSVVFSPGQNSGLFINTNNVNNYKPSIPVEKLSSLTIDGEHPIEHIYKPNEVIWGPHIHRAADIFMIPRYGYEISPKLVPSYLSAPATFGDIRTGTHRLKGVFMAYGPDIKEGTELKRPLLAWDVAPTILHMLNLHIPNYMDGTVLKEIFKKESEPAQRAVLHQ